MSALTRPWLPRTHRNFFIIYAGTIIFHLWCAASGLLGPDSWYTAPAFRDVNLAGSPEAWATVNLAIGACLWAGLHLESFRWSRYVLGVAGAWVWLRFFLIALAAVDGADIGNSLPNLFLVGMVHVAQVLEPPLNPETMREGS